MEFFPSMKAGNGISKESILDNGGFSSLPP